MVLRCWVRLCRVVVGLSLVALLAWPVGGQTAHLRMIDAVVPPSRAGVALEAMELVTSGCTGLWFPEVSAGQRVGAGEPPGAITDSFGNVLGRVVLLGLSSAAR
jgi:hypothetical protein